MTEVQGAKSAPHTITDDDRAHDQDPFAGLSDVERRAALDWVGEHLPRVRQSAFGQRVMYWYLGASFIVGLASDIGGYLIKTSTTTEPLALIGDLLYALGWALWTGVVVVVFLQIIPEAKQRQYKRALDAYEAARRADTATRGEKPSSD